MLTSWDRSLTARAELIHFSAHAYLDEMGYSLSKEDLDALDDAMFKWAAFEFRSYGLNASDPGAVWAVFAHEMAHPQSTFFQELLDPSDYGPAQILAGSFGEEKQFPDPFTAALIDLARFGEEERVQAFPKRNYDNKHKSLGARTTLGDGFVECISSRVALESSLYVNTISLVDYEASAEQWRLVADEIAKQRAHVVDAQQDRKEFAALQQEFADLKAEVKELRRTQSPQYPPQFWIALAVAACSWLVTLYNLIFSFLKERRERRKDKREDATVSVYSESDLQRALTHSNLSTALKKNNHTE